MCRVLAHEVHRLRRWCGQPLVVLVLVHDDDHALLIAGLVKVLEQFVFVGVDGEHSEGQQFLASCLAVARPQAGYTHGQTVLTLNSRGHSAPTPPIGLVDSFDWNNAVLTIAPCIPKTGLLSDGF